MKLSGEDIPSWERRPEEYDSFQVDETTVLNLQDCIRPVRFSFALIIDGFYDPIEEGAIVQITGTRIDYSPRTGPVRKNMQRHFVDDFYWGFKSIECDGEIIEWTIDYFREEANGQLLLEL